MISTTSALLYADNTSGNDNGSDSSDEGSGPESDASDSGIESEEDPVKGIVAFTQGVRPRDLRWSKREDNYVFKQGVNQLFKNQTRIHNNLIQMKNQTMVHNHMIQMNNQTTVHKKTKLRKKIR